RSFPVFSEASRITFVLEKSLVSLLTRPAFFRCTKAIFAAQSPGWLQSGLTANAVCTTANIRNKYLDSRISGNPTRTRVNLARPSIDWRPVTRLLIHNP